MIHTPSHQFLKGYWRLPKRLSCLPLRIKFFRGNTRFSAPLFGVPEIVILPRILSRDLKVSFISVKLPSVGGLVPVKAG